MELCKFGWQSNRWQTEGTNNSSRKKPALFISILHALKSCQLFLRQTAAAVHTIPSATQSGSLLYIVECMKLVWTIWQILIVINPQFDANHRESNIECALTSVSRLIFTSVTSISAPIVFWMEQIGKSISYLKSGWIGKGNFKIENKRLQTSRPMWILIIQIVILFLSRLPSTNLNSLTLTWPE